MDPVDILTPLEKSGFWEGVVRTLSLSFNCCSLILKISLHFIVYVILICC